VKRVWARRACCACDSPSVFLVPVGLVFFQVASFARQQRPQPWPRYFWSNSMTNVRRSCPISTRSGEEHPNHSLASLAEPRSSRSDSCAPRCYAWSRAGHPRREVSSSGVGGSIQMQISIPHLPDPDMSFGLRGFYQTPWPS
jgi:hypothetical protein